MPEGCCVKMDASRRRGQLRQPIDIVALLKILVLPLPQAVWLDLAYDWLDRTPEGCMNECISLGGPSVRRLWMGYWLCHLAARDSHTMHKTQKIVCSFSPVQRTHHTVTTHARGAVVRTATCRQSNIRDCAVEIVEIVHIVGHEWAVVVQSVEELPRFLRFIDTFDL